MGDFHMKKRYLKYLTALFVCIILLSGCNASNTQTDTARTSNASKSEVTSDTQEVTSAPTDLDINPNSDFEYKYDSELQGVLVGYKGNATTVRFPDTINGDPVVGISQTKTSVPSSITAVSIPDGVKVIGAGAFDGYTGLTSITIPNSVTIIDYEAFTGCTELTSVIIPDNVTSIENSAFQGCKSLTNIEIPDSVTRIGDLAFSGCTELTSISIPDSVTSIGSSAFSTCEKLADITLPDSVDLVSDTFYGTYWLNKQPDGFICIGTSLLGYKGEPPTTITIPDGVASISERSFQNCFDLISVTIPESVTSIAKGAFFGCSKLRTITIPDSINEIDKDAFYGCSSLDNATKDRINHINPDVQFN